MADETPPATSPSPSEKRAATARKWRRRLVRVIVVVIVLVMAFRALIHVIFPPVLRSVAGIYGLTASYDKLDLYMFGGDVGVWGLKISPQKTATNDDSAPILTASYVRGSISLWELLRGHLHVERAEAEDTDLILKRTADGKLPLLERFTASGKTPPTTAPAQPTSISLEPPLWIEALRLQNARLHLRDEAVAPATDLTLALNLLVRDIGSLTDRTHIDMQLTSPQALGVLSVQGDGMSRDGTLQAEFSAKMYGLNLLPAKAYLAPLGLVPTANNLQGDAGGELTAHVTPAKAATTTQPAVPGELSAEMNLHDIRLNAESIPAIDVKSIDVYAPSLISSDIHVKHVSIDGVRVHAERTQDGKLSFAGIELSSATPAPATQPAAVPVSSSSSAAPVIDLDELSVGNTRVEFIDNLFATPNRIALDIPKFTVTDFSTSPARATTPAQIVLNASAPGIARTIDVKAAAILADAKQKSADIAVHVSGIQPSAVADYLRPLGVTSTLTDGDFSCHVHATAAVAESGDVTAGLKLTDLILTNEQQQLLAMPRIEIDNARLDPATAKIHLNSIAMDGPTLPITRDASGINALGFHLSAPPTPVTPTTQPAVVSAPATQPSKMVKLPTLQLDRFAWHGADIHFTDQSDATPLDIALKNLAVDGQNLAFDSSATQGTPGTIAASFDMPGLFDHFSASGHVAPTGQSVAFDLKGESSGITIDTLKPILKAAYIEPTLKQGALRFAMAGSLGQSGKSINGDFSLHDIAFTDGDTNWLSLGAMKIDHATFDGRTAEVGSIDIDAPAVRVERDASGQLTIAGIRLLPVPPQPTLNKAPAAPTPTQLDLTLPIVARVDAVRVNGASLTLHDEDILTPADMSAKVSFTGDHFVAGIDAPPSPFTVDLSSPGVIGDLHLGGTLLANPHHQALDLMATGTNIQGGGLDAYLPPNLSINLHGGSLAAKLSTSIEPNPAGGSTASFDMTDAALRDGQSPDPLAAVGALRLDVDRVDIPANIIAIKEIAIEHASISATQNDEGIFALGARVAPQPLRAVKTAAAAPEFAASTQASDVAALTAAARQKPPLITIDKIALGLDQLKFQSSALGQPLVIKNASLTNTTPVVMLGDRPTSHPPFDLAAKASVVDAIDSIAVTTRLAPFANEPFANLQLNVDGIRGQSLTKLLPQLKSTLNADDLKNGKFITTVGAQFSFTRQGLFGIDMSRDIKGTFDVKDVALTEAGNPKVLAGVQSIHGEGLRYAPVNGSLVVKTLDIDTPKAQIVRDAAGIHALGLTVMTSSPNAPSTTTSASIPSTQPQRRALEVTPSSQPAPVAGGEMGIGRLTVNGIDLTIEDRVGKPATILPINQLDLNVNGLSTAALTEPNKPIRFDALIGAGKVPLPPRKETVGAGLEPREVFSEASASGDFTLVPKPAGYFKASLSGLEMTAIRGLASDYGISLGGGTFDVRIDGRMNGGNSFNVKIDPTFNDLRLKEVANGPIQRILQLPTPPDVAISTLEDADGSITFPLVVPIDAGKLDMGAVIASAAGSVGKVLSQALIAAPLKAAKLVAMLGGIDIGGNRAKDLAPATIEYAPGESQLSGDQLKTLDGVIQQMRDDPTIQVTLQHTLGQADLALAEQRANPLAGDSRQLAENLRQKKFDLQRQQAKAAVHLRVVMATDDASAQKAAADDLRAVSTRLKENGDDLDELLDLLRPGAAHQAERRTRASAVLLGDLRLRAVQSTLLSSGLPNINDRVRRANAQFNPDPSGKPGTVTLVLTRQAKS